MSAPTTVPARAVIDIDANAHLFYEVAALMIQYRLAARQIWVNQFDPQLVYVVVDTVEQVQAWADYFGATMKRQETSSKIHHSVRVTVSGRDLEIWAIVDKAATS